ncbi:MAG: glycosyltransferase [Meiothermus sp.]|uniref:glycosyltransferase family 2 protein n=1 Tax=Meiothermus sp. TaxID=1955249 RepID=UPI0025F3B6C3|nr:glycosyltransferase family 2 protein [Meiothermus sp.]MCS7195019.1 glycosyltransferase [Meiothermus sp.]MDW8089898.1 glycosyltransferase family 2 protein [Meiothermus sp.]
MATTFSIVIPTQNRAGLLARVVRAFLEQEGVSFELIVVDDGSTDATPEALEALKDPRLLVLRQPNRGLAQARNAGLARARGAYVLFNDDDVVPEEGFLQAHLELHRRYPAAAAVSRLYLPESLGQHPFVRYWRARMEGGVRGRPDGAPLGWGGFWFASLSLPRALAEAFAPFAGYGWEEHELGWRLWRKGVRPRLARKARAAHEDRLGLEAALAKQESMGRMAWRFYRLHPHPLVALWTGVHPLSRAYKRLAYPWARAEQLLRERAWEEAPGASGRYRFLLEAAYTRGLLEGAPG